MSLFFENATKHYYKSREVFTSGLVKAPTLFITSNADDLSSPSSVIKAQNEVMEKNLEVRILNFSEIVHNVCAAKNGNEAVWLWMFAKRFATLLLQQ